MAIEELRDFRIQKLKLLTDAGMECYPASSRQDALISTILADWETFEKKSDETHIVGRIMALRGQGAIMFADLFDGTGKIQVLLKQDEMDEKLYSLFEKAVDLGDFIEVGGTFFVTKRGEKSLAVKNWRMLSKSLLPLPEKRHGLQDFEERYRKRYLDILFDPELKDMIAKKAKFWSAIRAFMVEKGFLEVETPTLEVTTGGAEANPFKTHHNDFDLDVYLRISVGELWQKRLMAASFPKTFEIGRVFRNEGTSAEHLQEFTNMEFYMAYADYHDGMNLVKELYRYIAKEVFGKTKFETRGHTFDLADEWPEIDYVSKVQEITGVDVLAASEEAMKKKLDELHVEYKGENRERLTDTLWKYCRKQIAGPAFLINHPTLVAPLSKANPDNKQTAQKFQPIIAGSEVGNGYTEVNDPLDQRERFELQQKLIERGDTEAMMPEWDFVEMLEHGMPPTCGFGFGERLFAFLVDKPLRETQIFPLMKPKES
jgi:lysyl-tRNA synthetase class 2